MELRAATSLAPLSSDQGKRDTARTFLAPLFASFTKGSTRATCIDAKALLDRLA